MTAPSPTQPKTERPKAEDLPITFLDAKKILPRRYVIHKHTIHCKACSTNHEYSQCYAFNEMSSRTGAGKAVIHLVPVDHIEYNLPVEVLSLQPKIVPLCHECVGTTDLSHLPDPRSWDEWKQRYVFVATNELRSYGKPKSEAPFRKSKVPFTIDDLL